MNLDEILKEAEENLRKVTDSKQLEELRVNYLGKKGKVTSLLKNLKDMAEEERPKFGAMVNDVKATIETQISKIQEAIEKERLNEKLKNETIDVTLPSNKPIRGSKHPLNRIIEEVEDMTLFQVQN